MEAQEAAGRRTYQESFTLSEDTALICVLRLRIYVLPAIAITGNPGTYWIWTSLPIAFAHESIFLIRDAIVMALSMFSLCQIHVFFLCSPVTPLQ